MPLNNHPVLDGQELVCADEVDAEEGDGKVRGGEDPVHDKGVATVFGEEFFELLGDCLGFGLFWAVLVLVVIVTGVFLLVWSGILRGRGVGSP